MNLLDIFTIPTELIWKILDYLPVQDAQKFFNNDDQYWNYRFKIPQFNSRKEMFIYMHDRAFHPFITGIMARRNCNALSIFITYTKMQRKKEYKRIFVELALGDRTGFRRAFKCRLQLVMMELLRTNPLELYMDDSFLSVVHGCIKLKYTRVLQMLIERNYKLDITNVPRNILDKFTGLEYLIGYENEIDDKGNTLFHTLILNNSYQPFISLLKKFGNSCNLKWKNDNGETVLLIACTRIRSDLVLELLNYDCDPLYINNGTNAYLLALRNKWTDVSDELFRRYGDLCIPSTLSHITPLMNAIKWRNDDIACMLIDKYPDRCFPSVKGNNGTALFLAISNMNEFIARKIINKFGLECCPESVSDDKTTLMLAMERDFAIANKLLDTFSDLNFRYMDKYGHGAILYGCKQIGQYQPMYEAMRKEALIKLINAGCDLNCTNINSGTAVDILLSSSSNIYEEVIIKMIDAGYNIKASKINLFNCAIRSLYKNLMLKLIEKRCSYTGQISELIVCVKKIGWDDVALLLEQ